MNNEPEAMLPDRVESRGTEGETMAPNSKLQSVPLSNLSINNQPVTEPESNSDDVQFQPAVSGNDLHATIEPTLDQSKEHGKQVADLTDLNPSQFNHPPTLEPSVGSCHSEAQQKDIAAKTSTKQVNYLVRHWRGELTLGISYWVNGFVGTFLGLMVANTLAALQDTADIKFIAALTALVYVTAILGSVWQIVGIWRSASNHVSRGGKSTWATLAKLAVVFGGVNCVTVTIKTYVPQTLEMVSIVAGDKKLPPYKIRVLPGGAEVEYRGGLRAGSAKELEHILSAVPQAKVLHIESGGGRIREARNIIKLVRERGLTTYSSEYCLSAATFILMAGKERVIGMGAKIGFHAGTLPGATIEQQRELHNLARTTMQSSGIAEPFINRVLATPSKQMWYPTYDEMRVAGVVTSQSAGERFASSMGMPDVNLDAAVESLGTYPCFRVIKKVEPVIYAKMMTNFVAALRSGKSEGEAIATMSEVAGSMMSKYFPTASDEALLALRDQWIAILTKYKDNNSQGCIAVFTQAKINFKRLFPEWNMTNSLLVMEKVINSGATGVPVLVNKKLADEDLDVVLKPLSAKYGDDVKILSKQSEWRDNSQKVCDMLLLMYQEEAALPDKRSANLIRYLLTSE